MTARIRNGWRGTLAAGLVAAAAAASSAPAGATDWPMYGANPERTNAAPGVDLQPPFRVVWSRRGFGHGTGTTFMEFGSSVYGRRAYVETIGGWVTAYDVYTGRTYWKKQVAPRFASAPAIVPDRRELVVSTHPFPDGSGGRGVLVVGMDDGEVKWRFKRGTGEASPAVVGSVAYVASKEGRVYALDLARRRVRWSFRNDGSKITASPTIHRNRVYIVDYGRNIWCLDRRSGRVVWHTQIPGKIYAAPVYAGGRLFVVDMWYGIRAFRARDGELLWGRRHGTLGYAGPTYLGGAVYAGDYSGRVRAYRATDGKRLWRRRLSGKINGSLQATKGLIWVAANRRTNGQGKKEIVAFDPRTGAVRWRWNDGGYVPIAATSRVILLHASGRITAVVPAGASLPSATALALGGRAA